MGYRGFVEQRDEARRLRAGAATLAEIATALGVSRSTVSVWVRDVEFTPRPRNRGAPRQRPHPLHVARLAEVDALRADGIARIGELSAKELLIAGTALYAGEGSKRDGSVEFANTDPRMVLFFVTWLRRCFTVAEARLRVRPVPPRRPRPRGRGPVLVRAHGYSAVQQFIKPYRAVADSSIRSNKHPIGVVPTVDLLLHHTHRAIMGLIGCAAIVEPPSGVAQLVEQSDC